MSAKPTAPKNIPWRTVPAEDWAKGCAHVARLMGVTAPAARAAHKRLEDGRRAGAPEKPVPDGLRPTDSPGAVAAEHGVSLPTARKWLASVGRPPAPPGRRPRG